MQDYVRWRAFGKINLALNVGQLRPDGFHEVSMIMQSIGLWDELTLERRVGSEITLDCNLPFLAAGPKNIAYRAAQLMQQEYGLDGFHIHLNKRIPIAAGLAGGSTDAAAVIRGVNRLFELNLPMDTMLEIGGRLGSDVPFCLLGGTCLATGRGEKLKRLTPMQETHVALVKPNFGISTPWSYQHFDPLKAYERADMHKLISAIGEGNLTEVCAQMVNQLEPLALETYPVIKQIKEDLVEQGAEGAMMTGSGPTVFGLFAHYETAREAVRRLKARYPWRYQVLYCRTPGVRRNGL